MFLEIGQLDHILQNDVKMRVALLHSSLSAVGHHASHPSLFENLFNGPPSLSIPAKALSAKDCFPELGELSPNLSDRNSDDLFIWGD